MSFLDRIKRLFPSWGMVAVAVAGVTLATFAQFALEGVYGIVFPWVTYCFAVFSSAWYGGLRCAVLAIVLGYLATTLFFVSPGTLSISGKDTLTAFGVYVAYGLFAALLAESLHRARGRAERAADKARRRSTLLKRREEALQESHNRLQTLLQMHTRTETILRHTEQRFRIALSSGAVTVFEQNSELRYVWVYPQDPDFPEGNIGSADSELLPAPDGQELMQLKAEVLRTGQGVRRIMRATLPSGVRYYDLLVEATRDSQGRIIGVCGAALDVTSQVLFEDSLKQADKQKNEFLATLAHELRGPLAAIKYANDLARLGEAARPASADMIDRQVRQLTRLIEDLLDITRITQGKVQLEYITIDASDIVQRAQETVRPLMESHRHQLSIEVASVDMPLRGDAARLEQIVVNLLTNAAKYTPEGGRIRLSAAPLGSEIIFRVRDNGIGIAPHMLPQVFDLYKQVDRSRARSEGGLGIGLTLVRRLVELHGGTVTAASDGIGRGSEFVVRLPRARESVAIPLENPSFIAAGHNRFDPSRSP